MIWRKHDIDYIEGKYKVKVMDYSGIWIVENHFKTVSKYNINFTAKLTENRIENQLSCSVVLF